MLNRNLILTGFIVGVLLPTLSFLMLYQIFSLLEIKSLASTSNLSPNFRERTLAIVAIAINLIPLNIYRRRRWDLAIRGVVIATSSLALVWIVRYGVSLF